MEGTERCGRRIDWRRAWINVSGRMRFPLIEGEGKAKAEESADGRPTWTGKMMQLAGAISVVAWCSWHRLVPYHTCKPLNARAKAITFEGVARATMQVAVRASKANATLGKIDGRHEKTWIWVLSIIARSKDFECNRRCIPPWSVGINSHACLWAKGLDTFV